MPWIDKRAQSILLLYQRCKSRGCLPGPGGLLDQDERIMRWFDVLDTEIAEFHRKVEDDARSGVEKKRALRELNGRNA